MFGPPRLKECCILILSMSACLGYLEEKRSKCLTDDLPVISNGKQNEVTGTEFLAGDFLQLQGSIFLCDSKGNWIYSEAAGNTIPSNKQQNKRQRRDANEGNKDGSDFKHYQAADSPLSGGGADPGLYVASGVLIGAFAGKHIEAVIGGFIRGILCLIACKDDPPTPNKPPSITCKTIPDTYYASSGQTSAKVSWELPTVTDPEDGDSLQPKLIQGKSPGSTFERGSHTIIYKATDSQGGIDVCYVSFTVKVVTCEPPTWPDNGYIVCGGEIKEGRACEVRCATGYEMDPPQTSNKKKIMCTTDASHKGRFDAPIPSCKAITCPSNSSALSPQHGKPMCSHSDHSYDTVCITQCDPGYKLKSGNTLATCEKSSTWSAPLPSCKDGEAPSIRKCPSLINVFTDRGKITARVNWTAPIGTDNSGEAIVKQIKGNPPNSEFPVGLHEIRYQAEDKENNLSPECVFFVNVRESFCSPPYLEDRFLTYNCSDEFRYGSVCELKCMGNFPVDGKNITTCERRNDSKTYWDWGGPKPKCLRNPCIALEGPKNGAIACDKWMFGLQCQMQCRAPYDIPYGTTGDNNAPFQGLFVCSEKTGKWNPTETVPGCTEQRRPHQAIALGKLFYYSGDCNDDAVKDKIKDNFIKQMEYMEKTGWDGICPDTTQCNVDNVAVTCGAGSGRRKRSTGNGIRLEFRLAINNSIPNLSPAKSFVFLEKVIANMSSAVQNISKKGLLNVDGLTVDTSSVAVGYASPECGAGETVRWSTMTCVPCPAGTYLHTENYESKCLDCPVGTYKDNDKDVHCTKCPASMSTLNVASTKASACKEICTAGHYSETGLVPCNPCPVSTYQNVSSSTKCTKCPSNQMTQFIGSTSAENCTDFDMSITSSGNFTLANINENLSGASFAVWIRLSGLFHKFEPIKVMTESGGHIAVTIENYKLKVNIDGTQYSSKYSVPRNRWFHVVVEFDSIKSSLNSFIDGANVMNSTIAKSSHGTFIHKGNEIMAELMSTSETEVSMSALSVSRSSLSQYDLHKLSSVCHGSESKLRTRLVDLIVSPDNGVELIAPSQCDNIDDCDPNPCNGFSCTDLVNDYMCSCMKGYSGKSCEIAPSYCSSSTCKNGGTCHDIPHDFNCSCPTGFKGKTCETIIINGGWSVWEMWSDCSVTCGGGIQRRTKQCNSPPPDPDGHPCSNVSSETKNCSQEKCQTCGSIRRGFGNVLYCNYTSDGHQVCQVGCRQGLTFLLNHLPDMFYICGPNTSYQWSNSPPSCAAARGPSAVSSVSTLSYVGISCSNVAEVEQQLREKASNEYPCVRNGTCEFKIQAFGCSSARKSRSQREVKIDIKLTIPLSNDRDLGLETLNGLSNATQSLNDLLNALRQIEATVASLNKTPSFTDFKVDGQTYSSPISQAKGLISCAKGEGQVNAVCVTCPSGTYAADDTCELCSIGNYQDNVGQTECKVCPSGYTTETVASRDISDCIEPSSSITVNARESKTPEPPSRKEIGDDDDLPLIPIILVPLLLCVSAVIIIAVIFMVKAYKRRHFREKKSYFDSWASMDMVKPDASDHNPKPRIAFPISGASE